MELVFFSGRGGEVGARFLRLLWLTIINETMGMDIAYYNYSGPPRDRRSRVWPVALRRW